MPPNFINRYNTFIFFYFFIALLLAPINLLSFDTYYYWEWSRHLALSYYDGSPMIAYLIKLSTSLFGDTLFALSILAIALTALTGRILYKTANLFLSKGASYIALSLWLFSPLVTMDLLKQTTYDTPLTLFWALTLYYTVRFLALKQIKDIYFIGISAGLMMLSKYTGVILVIALLIFLITTNYRYLFKTYQFYAALMLSVLIFSPVLVWNYQHEWLSFIYQLTSHELSNTANPFFNTIWSFFHIFLPALNLMLIPPLFCWLKNVNKQDPIISLCRVVCTVFICFYLFSASHTDIREYWLTPYLISSALLGGYCFQTFNYHRTILSLIGVYAVISVIILVINAYPLSVVMSKKLISYRLLQQFNQDYPQPSTTILTSGWFEARGLFFLNNKPAIYTLGCGMAENQYHDWSKEVREKIANKTLKEAVYIDSYERSGCLANYFDQCERLPTRSYIHKHKNYNLYAYRCRNV